MKILVVDDDKNGSELAEIYLKEAGYEVTTTQACQKVLENIDAERFDLVIMDIDMPGSDTFDLLCSINEKCPELRVMIHTGFDDHKDIEKWKERAAAFMVKSSDMEKFVKQVKGVLA